MKNTINTTEIQAGDMVIGFNKVVSFVSVERSRWGAAVTVIFEDGEIWNTSGAFNTSVMR